MRHHHAVADALVAEATQAGPAVARITGDGAGWQQMERLRTEVIPGLDPPVAASFTVVVFDSLCSGSRWWMASDLLGALAKAKPPFDQVDLALLFDLICRADSRSWQVVDLTRIAVAGAERLGDPCPDLRSSYVRVLAAIESQTADAAARAKVRNRLLDLLRALDGAGGQVGAGRVDLLAFRRDDGWGRAVVGPLAEVRSDSVEISDVLNHAATLTVPRPSKAWRRRAVEVVDAAPGAPEVLHGLLAAVTRCPGVTVTDQWGGTSVERLGAGNQDLVRGLVWCAGALDPAPDWLLPELLAISRESMRARTKVFGSSIAVIGELDDPGAVGVLVELQRSTRHRSHLKVIEAALEAAADRVSLSRSELLETTVAESGLDAGGHRTFVLGDLTATVAIGTGGKVTTSWARAGRPLRSAPDDAKLWPDELAGVKRSAAAVRKLVSSERARLELLTTETRSWPVAVFDQRYLTHPVTASLARQLIWWLTFPGGDREAARPDGAGWIRSDGTAVELHDDVVVSPWHPLLAEPDAVFAWRRSIEDDGWRQPFKQAFREIYLLTPAEEETAVYSNRFAAHILDYPRAFALMKERGWSSNYLGGWDSGLEGEATRDFPDQGLRAAFFHEPAATEGGGRWDDVVLCATDQVRFRALGRGEQPAVALHDVPPMVFSEAMRDVDLFVGVSSMANDPTWVDRGADGHLDYWHRAAFGDLTATAETRHDVLEHLLPKLKIADRTRLDGRFLEVRGQRRTYRIHLGSANIQMAPDDQYLCIVTARKVAASALRYVPFDGDHTLSVILSKAFLLADDHKITDPSILAQIQRR